MTDFKTKYLLSLINPFGKRIKQNYSKGDITKVLENAIQKVNNTGKGKTTNK